MNAVYPDAPLQAQSRASDHSRTRGRSVEEDFALYAKRSPISQVGSRTYIAVQWWQCALRQAVEWNGRGFFAVPAVQAFLDLLARSGSYFAVSRGDDGIYERLPPDTVVFSVGEGDISVPLLPPDPDGFLRIIEVPEELQTPRMRETPDRGYGWSIEKHFSKWVTKHAEGLRSRAAYMPVYWWNNSAVIQMKTNQPFAAVPTVQAFVDDGSAQGFPAFTVSRGADGIYEKIPAGLVVFSAGGGGDVPLPHLAEIEPSEPGGKTLLASFVGAIECGGPDTPRPMGRSSWDPNGAGATIRRKMRDVFSQEPDCLIQVQSIAGNWNANDRAKHEQFRETARRSWFGLAPRGYGKTSYRLYEMLHFGAIPVYIYDEPWLPYLDRLDWTEFAVLCHASELERLPSRLRSIPVEQRVRMLDRGAELVPDWFTADAVCRRIMEYASRL